MDTTMIEALNKQIQVEFHAAYTYLSFSVALKAAGYDGMGSWFRKQYAEECEHAMQFVHYLEERGAAVTIPAIVPDAPACTEPLAIFETTLAMEKDVTSKINDLMTLAVELKDYASQDMLFGLVREQVEEESTVSGIIDKMKLAGGNSRALLHLDDKLGAR
ncbi:MAG: ferritin [Akkermansia sp.]